MIDTPTPADGRPRRWWGLLAAVALVIAGVDYAVEDRQRDERAKAQAAATATPASTIPGSTKSAALAERHRAVDAVLDRRSKAVMTNDPRLFLQDVDPALHKEQRILFANLADLGMGQIGYQQVEERYDPGVLQRHGPSAYLVRVMMTYRIDRVDDQPVKTELGYTFSRRTGRWMLVDDDDLDRDLGPGAHREPWDLGRFEVHRGQRVTVLVDAGAGRRGRNIVDESREALDTVTTYWPRKWQGSVLIIALGDKDVRDTRFADEDVESAASATSTFASLPGEESADGTVSGAYIVINPTERDRVDEILLSHEFTHVATADLGGYEPLWLAEGAAEYVSWKGIEAISGPDEPAEWEADVVRTALPSMNSLPSDDGFYDNPGDVYGVSWLAVRRLVKDHGVEKVSALYEDIARRGVNQAARDRIMLAHTGMTEATLFLALKSR